MKQDQYIDPRHAAATTLALLASHTVPGSSAHHSIVPAFQCFRLHLTYSELF